MLLQYICAYNFCYLFLAMVIGFNASKLFYDEPEALSQQVIYLLKENNQPTEQTFQVQINYETITGTIGSATRGEDFLLVDFSVQVELVRRFEPLDTIVTLPLLLFPDDIAEGSEGFNLEISPFLEPKFSVPTPSNSVSRQVTVEIVDNDRKSLLTNLIYFPRKYIFYN